MKRLSYILLALVIVMASFALTACSIEGTWKVSTVKMSGAGMNITYDVSDKDASITEDSYVLKINGDKTWEMSVNFMGQKATEKGTWEKDGSDYILKDSQGVGEKCTVSGNTLTLTAKETVSGSTITVTIEFKRK